MGHEVLAALPALHATFIGLVGAVYSVFVMYGYQKVEEARHLLEAATRLLVGKFQPGMRIGHIDLNFYDQSGGLNLTALRKVMRSASLIFPSEKGKLIPTSISGERPDDEVFDCFINLINIIWVASSAYPLVVDDKNKDISYNEKRLQDLRSVVREIAGQWNSSGVSLLRLAERAEEIENTRHGRSMINDLHRSKLAELKKWGILSESEYADRIDYHVVENEDLGFIRDTKNFFDSLMYCNEQIIPEVRNALEAAKKSVLGYKVGLHARIMIITGAVMLLLGVLTPLIIISLENTLKWRLSETLEFWIFIYSFIPYFFAALYLWKILAPNEKD